MGQSTSSYKRQQYDAYQTPEWVTNTVTPFLSKLRLKRSMIWEPACGDGQMIRALEDDGFNVGVATDIQHGLDFFGCYGLPDSRIKAIVTNPPFSTAADFASHAIDLMAAKKGVVALLLRADFDSAKTRRYLFADCPMWSQKIVLLNRIVWFVDKNGKPKASPSENHAWYIWNHKHTGPATVHYAEKRE